MTLYKKHDKITFTKFNRNPNFVPMIFYLMFARSENHENYSPYRINFIHDGITYSLMKQ